jgi:nucleoid-associated protein YgaU
VLPLPQRSSQPPTARVPDAERTHVVQRGDNLWNIARRELQRRGASDPGDAATAHYLQRVIAANVARLRSGDPNLIFPGETVALPQP